MDRTVTSSADPSIDGSPVASAPQPEPASEPPGSPLSRRGFLRVAGAAGLVGRRGQRRRLPGDGRPELGVRRGGEPDADAARPPPTPEPSASVAPSPSASPIPNLPAGWTEHDLNGQIKVRRFVGNLAGPLGMSPFLDNVLGPNTDDPEFTMVPQGNQPLDPVRVDPDGTKVFELTIDEIEWPIDAVNPPVKALGYNKMWPGPTIRVTEGDKVRISFTNNMHEPTGVHFHGIELDGLHAGRRPVRHPAPFVPGRDVHLRVHGDAVGLAHVPLAPQRDRPGGPRAAGRVHRGAEAARRELPAQVRRDPGGRVHPQRRAGRLHDQRPRVPGHDADRRQAGRQGADPVHERGHDDAPVAHPRVPDEHRGARRRASSGSAGFKADTLGVNPGERWDAIIDCDRPGVWAFHCHILPHVEGPDGMYGMVTALVILPPDAT